MDLPNVSVTVDITDVAAIRLGARGSTGSVNFDMNAKLEEKERRSQMVVVAFNLLLTSKPSVVKFKVDGTVALAGKDEEIGKMLEVDPEMKVPYVFQKVYQNAFEAMYLLSTILKTSPPPSNLSILEREAIAENLNVESRTAGQMIEESMGQEKEDSAVGEGAGPLMEASERTSESVEVDTGEGKQRVEEHVDRRTDRLEDTVR